jgi:Peptidase A4 family
LLIGGALLSIQTRLGRRRLITIRLMLVLAAVFQLAGTAPASASIAVGGNVWSGAIDGGSGVSHVSGRLAIPKIDAGCGLHSNVAVWVGLGGYGKLPFAQNGITLTPSGMSAWFELLDKSGNGPVQSVALPMKTGDVVALNLAFSPGHTVLSLTWSNLTRHQSVTRRFLNAARWYNGSTAEWIVERAAFDARHDSPYLARFSPITFTNAVYGTPTTSRSAFPNTYTSTMYSRYVNGWHPMTQVTRLSNSQAFRTTWSACH